MTPLALILIFIVLLAIVPIAGITVTLLKRQKAVQAGEITLGSGINVLAIVAFALSLLALSIPAVICGHFALGQIKRTSERGWGFAATSLWIGYYGIVVGTLLLAVLIAGLVLIGA